MEELPIRLQLAFARFFTVLVAAGLNHASNLGNTIQGKFTVNGKVLNLHTSLSKVAPAGVNTRDKYPFWLTLSVAQATNAKLAAKVVVDFPDENADKLKDFFAEVFKKQANAVAQLR